MKYRVLQKGPWFYPQYKKWGFWFNYKTLKYNANGRLEMLPDCKITLKRALSALEEYQKPKLTIIHGIKDNE